MEQGIDYLIFRPNDVDLSRSPLKRSIAEPTYVLGAFNPGLARLSNDNSRQFWLKRGAHRFLALTSLSSLPAIVASGEADLACRITHMRKALFT